MEYYFFPWLKLEKREMGREKARKRAIHWYSVLLRRVQRQKVSLVDCKANKPHKVKISYMRV